MLYLDRYTIAGAKNKLKSIGKKNTQLSLGFDRESFLGKKNEIIVELESALEILDEDET